MPLVDKRLEQAKLAVIKLWSDYGPDWSGIAPSHLMTYMGEDCDYKEAVSLLLSLETYGYVEDTGKGAGLMRPSGIAGTNRFRPTRQLQDEAERDRQAWEEDEKDMQRIKDEWDAFDRDPPGS